MFHPRTRSTDMQEPSGPEARRTLITKDYCQMSQSRKTTDGKDLDESFGLIRV